MANASLLLFMGGYLEWVIILIVALLLFGKRLPDVMRSVGRGIVEFKKGVRGIEDEIESGTNSVSNSGDHSKQSS